MADTSFMARFGARLVTNGYAILPIGPGTKKPGRFQRGAWADYPEWNRHAERGTTEVEVATWASWPDCGIGIVGGAVAAIDIDIMGDADLALQIEQLARERLGDTPALRIGRAPKRMLVYRTTEPFRGIKRHPLEVLCLGQQFLAYAIHPDTGAPYAWPEEGLADIDITDLPEISAEVALAFLDEAYALLPDALRQRGLAAISPSAEGSRSHSQVGTLPAIEAALAWLPNAELDYDSWMRVGMALKGALGEAGADLFASWSAQAAKDVPATTMKAWASFKPDPRDGATVINYYTEFGITPATEVDFDLDNASPASGALRKRCQALIESVEDSLGGLAAGAVQLRAECGSAFFADLVAHKEVRETYLNTAAAADLRGRVGEEVSFGGITFRRYRGGLGFGVPTDKAIFYPEGVDGLFEIYYAPADTFETVNTLGLPLYARMIPDRDRDEWVRLEIESNPLPICTRPQVLRSARRT